MKSQPEQQWPFAVAVMVMAGVSTVTIMDPVLICTPQTTSPAATEASFRSKWTTGSQSLLMVLSGICRLLMALTRESLTSWVAFLHVSAKKVFSAGCSIPSTKAFRMSVPAPFSMSAWRTSPSTVLWMTWSSWARWEAESDALALELAVPTSPMEKFTSLDVRFPRSSVAVT
jgi:hypothetical protein